MSGRVDHAAEAEAILAQIQAGMRPEVVSAAVAGAQVHATLALVDAVREIAGLLRESEVAPVVYDDGRLATYGGVEIRPGDADPTPDYPEGGFCGAQRPGGGSQTCTWPAGHDGAHVAGNGTIAVEVWS